MNTITRFAPSPTGNLHIGAARTAVFNWLFARRQRGKFLLRMEDTDRLRSEKKFEDNIVDSLKWLGINWDGEITRQSGRLGVYAQYAQQLIDERNAYRCYVTADELERRRQDAFQKGQVFRYKREWSHLGAGHGKPYAIRFLVPPGENISIEDPVRGTIVFDSSEIEDFVLLKADGFPTYNFAATVDDAQTGISHVIRGDDHIINAPRQILIARALGFSPPSLVHVSMILGSDGKKLSKRHGAESLTDYRNRGYLPEAVLNYLVRLGWSCGDQEIFTKEELVEKFGFEGLGKSASMYDSAKFLWLNGKYLRSTSLNQISSMLVPFLQKQSLAVPSSQKLQSIVVHMRERSDTLADIVEQSRYFFTDDFEYEEKASKKFLGKASEQILSVLMEKLASVEDFSHNGLQDCFSQVMESTGLKLGKIAQPTRVALTGSTKSPGIFDVVEILGKQEVLRRLKRAICFIKSHNASR